MLGDRYEIRSTLGRGGMATVYEGRDRVLDRPVAIKVLAEKYAGDDKFVTRFQREAKAAAGLNHQNIVSVFDTGDTDGEHYIVMELIEGETLADLLSREGPLSSGRAARIAAQVANALQAAHERGFVHRDVKPANVMLSGSGDVKVMDFGIARAATDDTLTQTGMIMGTASYLSPEQSRGDSVDHRSDIYSLGCVLYEMVAGRPPFSGASPVSVAYMHVNEAPPPPSSLVPSIPTDLESVIMRSLEKDPARRLPSAEAFRQALTSGVEGETTEPLSGDTAVLPAQTEVLAAPPRRRGWLAAAIVAAILAIAGVTALALTGEERRTGGRGQRTEEPSPAEDSPDPVPPPVSPVDESLFALRILIDESQGLFPDDAATKVLEEADKANEEFLEGELDKAFEHLDKADEEIDEAVAKGETTEETAAALHTGVALVRDAMQAEVPDALESPPAEGKGSDSAPGNSENAPGQLKKD